MISRRLRLIERHSTPLLLILLLTVIALVLWSLGIPSLNRPVTRALIDVVLVTGIYIFVGNSGILSFAHVGLMAIAAYVTGWLTMPIAMKSLLLPGLPEFLASAHMSMLPATVIAAVCGCVAALLTGAVIMRLSGVAASIATLAVLAIVNIVAANWTPVTGGASALTGIPRSVGVWVALGGAVVAIVIAHLHGTSRFGLALRAAREDEVAAEACGIAPYWARLVAFVVSGLVVGIAGALHAQFLGLVGADSYYLEMTLTALTMLIVGGVASLSGAVVGVLALSTVIEIFSRLERGVPIGETVVQIPVGAQAFLIAVLLCIVLVFRKAGLMNGRELKLPHRWFSSEPEPLVKVATQEA